MKKVINLFLVFTFSITNFAYTAPQYKLSAPSKLSDRSLHEEFKTQLAGQGKPAAEGLIQQLSELLDRQPEGRLSPEGFSRDIDPLFLKLGEAHGRQIASEDFARFAVLYYLTNFQARYKALHACAGRLVPPFILGKMAVMIGKDFDYRRSEQWEEIEDKCFTELITLFSFGEVLKKTWLENPNIIFGDFVELVKTIYEMLKRAKPAEFVMLMSHAKAFLREKDRYFSSFAFNGSYYERTFGIDYVRVFSDYVALSSLDELIRWEDAFANFCEMKNLIPDELFFFRLQNAISKLETDEEKLKALERLSDELKALVWIIRAKGSGMKIDKEALTKMPPPLKGDFSEEPLELLDGYAKAFEDKDPAKSRQFLDEKAKGVLGEEKIEIATRDASVREGPLHSMPEGVREAPPEIIRQPQVPIWMTQEIRGALLQKKKAPPHIKALEGFIKMKALDIYEVQRELGIPHTDISDPRIQGRLKPLMAHLSRVLGEEGLERIERLKPQLIKIRQERLNGKEAEEVLAQFADAVKKVMSGFDDLARLVAIDESIMGAVEFKAVYIRGLILNASFRAQALRLMGVIEEILPPKKLLLGRIYKNKYIEELEGVCLRSFLGSFHFYQQRSRAMAQDHMQLRDLRGARKIYDELFVLRERFGHHLAVCHDESLRKELLPDARANIEGQLRHWKRWDDEFASQFQKHDGYWEAANSVTAGVEVEFNIATGKGEVLFKMEDLLKVLSDEERKDIQAIAAEGIDPRFSLKLEEQYGELTSSLLIRSLDDGPQALGREVTQLINEMYIYGMEHLPQALARVFRKYPQFAAFLGLGSLDEAEQLLVIPRTVHLNMGEGYKRHKNYLGIMLFEEVLLSEEERDKSYFAIRSVQFANPREGYDTNYRGKIEMLMDTPRSLPFDLCAYRDFLSDWNFLSLEGRLDIEERLLKESKVQFQEALSETKAKLEKGEPVLLNAQPVIFSFIMALTSWYSKSSLGEDPDAEAVRKQFPWVNSGKYEVMDMVKRLRDSGVDMPLLEGLSFRQMMAKVLHDPDFIREYLLFFGSVSEYLALLAFTKQGAPIPDISVVDAQSQEACAAYVGKTQDGLINKWRNYNTLGNLPPEPIELAVPIERKGEYNLAFITSRDTLGRSFGLSHLEFRVDSIDNKKGIRVPLSSPYVKRAYDEARRFLIDPATGEPKAFGSLGSLFPVVRDMIAANAKNEQDFSGTRKMLNELFERLTPEEQGKLVKNLIQISSQVINRGEINPVGVVIACINLVITQKAGFGDVEPLLLELFKRLTPEEKEYYCLQRRLDFLGLTFAGATAEKRGKSFERLLPTLFLELKPLIAPGRPSYPEFFLMWSDYDQERMRRFIEPLLKIAGHIIKANDELGLKMVRKALLDLDREMVMKDAADWPNFDSAVAELDRLAELSAERSQPNVAIQDKPLIEEGVQLPHAQWWQRLVPRRLSPSSARRSP